MSILTRLLAIVLHASAAAVMTWGYYEMTGSAFDNWVQTQKGGQMQFLTIQGLAMAWLTVLLGLAHDIFPQIRPLKTLKRTLGMISMPLEFIISIIYWSLLVFIPDLIIAKFPDEPGAASSSGSAPEPFRLGLANDLALHAAPTLALLVDFVLFETRYARKETTYGAPALAVAMAVWYGSWVEYCATYNGVFPYPFLTENTFPVRVGIYGGATTLAVVILWGINALHSRPLFG